MSTSSVPNWLNNCTFSAGSDSLVRAWELCHPSMMQCIIRYGMTAWYGTLSVQLKSRIAKIAMKVIGRRDSPSLQTIFETTVLSLAKRVCFDPSHVLFSEYELLPSGIRYRACLCKINRYGHSFIATSIALMNKRQMFIDLS